ncbi:MAG: aldo/keto reductase [Rhizobium sp.]|nr:MAG: aldo/keto reductase [Rhizobium sp.]
MPDGVLETRRLGSTNVSVSIFAFGGGPLGGIYRAISDSEAADMVAAALDTGVSYFDVAPLYGHGLAERRIGDGLRRHRSQVVLSTKVGRLLMPSRGKPASGIYADPLEFEPVYDYSHDGVMRSLEDSLQRLGLSSVDIVYIHDVTKRWHGDDAQRRFAEVMDGGYRALERLRGEGVIKAIGVGMNDDGGLARFAEAGNFDCFMLAGQYTLLDQSPLDHLFPICARRDISIVSAAPFNSGILATGTKGDAKFFYQSAPPEILERTRKIEAVCERHGVPLPAAALQFALGHPLVASVAAGSSSAAEVRQNVSYMTLPIPADFWGELKAEGLIRADAPC